MGAHGGDRCGWSSPFIAVVVGGSWGWSLLCVSMVVVMRKEATSHVVTMASCLTFHMRSNVHDLTCK